MPDTATSFTAVTNSFNSVAAKVAAARAQQSVYPVTYPLSGATTLKSTPEWFHSPYNATTNLDAGLTVQATGDIAHNQT